MNLLSVGAILFIGTVQLSCSQIKIKDSTWYGSLGTHGAVEFHTLTTEKKEYTLNEWAGIWSNVKRPIVCTHSDVLAEWKGNIEKLCSNYNACTYEQKQAIDKIYKNLDELSRERKSKALQLE